MSEKQRIEYSQLEAGFEFPASSYKLESAIVSKYLKAVEHTSSLYQDTVLVPPMAVAAYAMASLSGNISLPPGTIHVSQEFEFRGTVSINDILISYAKVSRKQSRGNFQLLNVDFNVLNKEQKTVLTGKTSFILPESSEAK
jgi:acyl dehydratase